MRPGAVLAVKCEDVDVLLGRETLRRRGDAELVVTLGLEIILYVPLHNPAQRAVPTIGEGLMADSLASLAARGLIRNTSGAGRERLAPAVPVRYGPRP